LGKDIGAAVGKLHSQNGVKLHMKNGIKEIKGTNGKVTAVVLNDGSEI